MRGPALEGDLRTIIATKNHGRIAELVVFNKLILRKSKK